MMINMQQQPAFIFTKSEKDLLLTLITVEQSKKCDNEKLLNQYDEIKKKIICVSDSLPER